MLERISSVCGVLNIAKEYGYNEKFIIRESSSKKGDALIEQGNQEKDHVICRVCLGALQEVDLPQNVEKTAKAIVDLDFEFVEFKFSIKVSLSTHIRMANYLYLAEKYFESNEVLCAAEKAEFTKTYLNWREKCIDVTQRK